MLERFPALLAAVLLSVYWFWVFVKLVKLGRKLGKDPNAMPREPVGQLMRVVWYPCVLILLIGVWLAAGGNYGSKWPPALGMLVTPLWRPADLGAWWWVLTAAASAIGTGCTLFTFVCWRKMGRSWRIGIDPGETLELVSTGPYRFVRHPIYALRMVINICAFIMAPTWLVLMAGGIDFMLLQIEARREERYMESKHGAEYARYRNSVGRFVPRSTVG